MIYVTVALFVCAAVSHAQLWYDGNIFQEIGRVLLVTSIAPGIFGVWDLVRSETVWLVAGALIAAGSFVSGLLGAATYRRNERVRAVGQGLELYLEGRPISRRQAPRRAKWPTE